MRVAAQHPVDVGQPYLAQGRPNAVGDPFIPSGGVSGGQIHLLADRHHRIEGGDRLLKHHGDVPAPQVAPAPLGRPDELLAAVTDRALHVSGAGQEPDHRQRRDALAAPRLPGDPDHPAGKERQGQPLHRPRPLAAGEVHLEVGDLEDGSRRPRLGERNRVLPGMKQLHGPNVTC